jgi:hypothetical protein
MLPLVAVCGLALSDVAFSVVLGAVNVALFYALLSRAETGDSTFKTWLCVLMGLGTPLWYCAALGSVWYTAHVAAITCLCLYALEVSGRNRPLLAGFWLGLGFLARAPVLLAFPLSLTPMLAQTRDPRQRMRLLFTFALGTAPALLGQAAYNLARFGSPLEFGYRWMNSPGPLMERQATWGQFSLHFFPENAYTLLIRPPLLSLSPLHVEPDPWGMGLLFTFPIVLETRFFLKNLVSSLRKGLFLSIILITIPSLLYFNTGSYQFGYRFALDWLPLGILLAALAAGGRLRRRTKILIVVGVLMHLWGVLWMYPNFNGQSWHLQYIR